MTERMRPRQFSYCRHPLTTPHLAVAHLRTLLTPAPTSPKARQLIPGTSAGCHLLAQSASKAAPHIAPDRDRLGRVNTYARAPPARVCPSSRPPVRATLFQRPRPGVQSKWLGSCAPPAAPSDSPQPCSPLKAAGWGARRWRVSAASAFARPGGRAVEQDCIEGDGVNWCVQQALYIPPLLTMCFSEVSGMAPPIPTRRIRVIAAPS